MIQSSSALILVSILLCYFTCFARMPIIPDEEATAQINSEIRNTIRAKEWNVDESLPLFQCFGKLFVSQVSQEEINEIEAVLDDAVITIERIKEDQLKSKYYFILSLVSHDRQELDTLFTDSNELSQSLIEDFRKNLSMQQTTTYKGLGCTALNLR